MNICQYIASIIFIGVQIKSFQPLGSSSAWLLRSFEYLNHLDRFMGILYYRKFRASCVFLARTWTTFLLKMPGFFSIGNGQEHSWDCRCYLHMSHLGWSLFPFQQTDIGNTPCLFVFLRENISYLISSFLLIFRFYICIFFLLCNQSQF